MVIASFLSSYFVTLAYQMFHMGKVNRWVSVSWVQVNPAGAQTAARTVGTRMRHATRPGPVPTTRRHAIPRDAALSPLQTCLEDADTTPTATCLLHTYLPSWTSLPTHRIRFQCKSGQKKKLVTRPGIFKYYIKYGIIINFHLIVG